MAIMSESIPKAVCSTPASMLATLSVPARSVSIVMPREVPDSEARKLPGSKLRGSTRTGPQRSPEAASRTVRPDRIASR